MVETQQSLAQTGISTFLSFGAKSVKPEILEKLLIGRQKTVDMLTQQATDIAEHGINAQLMLIGNRGMGKTHVLRVLYHRIQPLVRSRKIVVAYFVEEAYDVASYLDFLVRIIKDFIRWYAADAELLQQKLSILRDTPSVRQEELAEQIVADYVADKPLLILTENFDAILEALNKTGQAKLRSWLYRHNRISIMATAQALSPDLGREDRPFYQFFTTIYLKRLTYEDSLELLRTLAQTEHNQVVIDHLNGKGIGQVRAIHELVKGNHRLLVTFYEFLKADTLAKLSDIFLKTLNDLKPYYETYIRYLPPQQQKIVHYLALAVTPRNGTDISKDCFIDQKSLSKQLSDLQRSHLLEAYTDPADGRNKLYDLSEPLLRISLAIGEHTEGITPLFIDFLANWYNINELENQKERFWQLHLEESNEKLKQDYWYDYQARERAIATKLKEGKIVDEDINYLFGVGNEFYNKGDYKNAIEYYKKVIMANSGDYEAFYNLGTAYDANHEYDNAILAYQKVIEMEPNDYEVLLYLGVLYSKISNYDKAIENYQKVIEIRPDLSELFFNIGNTYSAKLEFDNAIKSYQKAIAIKPNFYQAFYNLGKAYCENGDYDKAIESYQRVTAIKPDDYWTFYNIGNIYYKKEDYDEAIKNYHKSIDVKTNFPPAWHNIGVIYEEKENFEKAFEHYQKAIEAGCNFLDSDERVFKVDSERISDSIVFILEHDKNLTKEKILHFEKLIEKGYGLPDELKISYLMLQTYRRYVLEKDKRAIYELPKEQREFFLREIVKE